MKSRLAAVAVAILALLNVSSPAAAGCVFSGRPWDEPLVLVLSGGGAKGAYEAGVAALLAEQGVPVRLVAGSSAGALNAAMIADGRVERLETLWRGLTRERVYSMRAPAFFAGLLPGWLTLLVLDHAESIFDPQPLRELVHAALDLSRIRASKVRLLVVTADLARREKRFFDNQTVTSDALMAAAAVPGAFPAVNVDGTLLVDGGLTSRAPVLDALEADPAVGRALVVMSYAPDEQGARPATMRRAIEEAFEMGMIHQINRDVDLARLRHPTVDVQVLAPASPLLQKPLDFEPNGIAQALGRGRVDAMACLRSWGKP